MIASFYLLLTYKPEKRSRNTDGHLLILFFPLQLNFNLFQRTFGFCPMQLPLEAVIKDKTDMNITCSSIWGDIWSLEEIHFAAKEAKVFIQWVIHKISSNWCFYKQTTGFPFWKATSVKFYLNILIWVVFRKIRNQNPLMSLALSWDSS